MARPLVTLHFHLADPPGQVVEAARSESRDEAVRGSPAFAAPPSANRRAGARIVGPLLRLANSLSTAALISLENSRLLKVLADPQEKKALFDGASRARLVPTPAPAYAADLRLLAPIEVADELRLNVDLWKRAMLAVGFALPPKADVRRLIVSDDPAAALAALPTFGGGKAGVSVIGIDVAAIERSADPEAAVLKLAEALRARKDIQLAPNTPSAQVDRLFGEILAQGARFTGFAPDLYEGFDAARDAFPLELLRALFPPAAASRLLAPELGHLATTELKLDALDPRLARGLLLRAASRNAAADGTPPSECVRASFTIANALLERRDADSDDAPATAAERRLAGEIGTNLERAIDAAKSAAPAAIADARKAKTRALRALPDAEAPVQRAALVAALKKACAAAVACAALLASAESADADGRAAADKAGGSQVERTASREMT